MIATPADGGEERLVLVLVRGDHRVNEIKLAHALGARSRPARTEEIEARIGPPGFIGPVGLAGGRRDPARQRRRGAARRAAT